MKVINWPYFWFLLAVALLILAGVNGFLPEWMAW